MRNNKQIRRAARQLLRSTFVDGAMDPARMRVAVRHLCETKVRNYLPTLEHLKRLVRLEEDRQMARVESAIALSAQEKGMLTDSLQQIYRRSLSISFREDPTLIGGIRIQVGGDIYDGSMRGRLRLLKEGF